MKHGKLLIGAIFISFAYSGIVSATRLPGGQGVDLLPTNPSSADDLRIGMADRTCGSFLPYKANPYRVAMAQNNITVTLGEHVTGVVLPAVCPPALNEDIDLGRLPAGNYTITVIEGPTGMRPGALVDNAPFTVSDARAIKTAPYVRLDYSGHWWDPNDSGWGLFIWHDTRSNYESMLAAWFTYTADGKPMWYVFQPRWQTGTSTFPADLAQASRPPGATSPPPTLTTAVSAGTASLDFSNAFGTNDQGKLTYAFNGGPTLVRTIKRFNP